MQLTGAALAGLLVGTMGSASSAEQLEHRALSAERRADALALAGNSAREQPAPVSQQPADERLAALEAQLATAKANAEQVSATAAALAVDVK